MELFSLQISTGFVSIMCQPVMNCTGDLHINTTLSDAGKQYAYLFTVIYNLTTNITTHSLVCYFDMNVVFEMLFGNNSWGRALNKF